MIELPETYVLSNQINESIRGKRILNAVANASPHKFAWFSGEPTDYQDRLTGKTMGTATPGTRYTCGGNVEIEAEDLLLVITTPIKYHAPGDKLPKKHQLLLEFEDGSRMTCTVQMWGSMFLTTIEKPELPGDYTVQKGYTPLDDEFTWEYFLELSTPDTQPLSVKQFLATEQRIPGLGNGVLQDILFNARLNPRKRMEQISKAEREALYEAVRSTLTAMAVNGGRDTEKDLYGVKGGYNTILSRNTLNAPCPVCSEKIIREAYLGGNIYYCPRCQPYVK